MRLTRAEDGWTYVTPWTSETTTSVVLTYGTYSWSVLRATEMAFLSPASMRRLRILGAPPSCPDLLHLRRIGFRFVTDVMDRGKHRADNTGGAER